MGPEQSSRPEVTKAFSAFAISNRVAMRLLRKAGLLRQLGEKRKGRKQPGGQVDGLAWGKLAGKERSFRNIAEHCLVVGMVADTIFRCLAENGHLTLEEMAMATKAAIVHDLRKRWELEFRYGTEVSRKSRFEGDSEEEARAVDWMLRQRGFSEEDLALRSFSKWTGRDKHILSPADVSLNSMKDLIAWIIVLADESVAHTRLVRREARAREQAERGEYKDIFTPLYRHLYGEAAYKQAKDDAKEIIGRVYDNTLRVMIEAERQLKTKIGLREDEDLFDFIQAELESRYARYQLASRVVSLSAS